MTNQYQNIKEGIEGHPAKWYADVFDLVFPNVSQDQANKLWKKQLSKSKKERKGEKDVDSDDE